MEAYFDNSATTAPCSEAVSAVSDALVNCWGNPSSLHTSGNRAKELLDSSRSDIAKKLGCLPEEIYFTSGATESNNTAIFGAAETYRRNGNRIVTTAMEHPAAANPIAKLEENKKKEAEALEICEKKIENFVFYIK